MKVGRGVGKKWWDERAEEVRRETEERRERTKEREMEEHKMKKLMKIMRKTTDRLTAEQEVAREAGARALVWESEARKAGDEAKRMKLATERKTTQQLELGKQLYFARNGPRALWVRLDRV